jgi:hypothetical protein
VDFTERAFANVVWRYAIGKLGGGHGWANSRKMLFLLSSRDPVWKGRTNRGTGR